MCVRCVMDTTDPEIIFDKDGVCNHCQEYDAMLRALPSPEERERQLDLLIDSIKAKGKVNDYDCIIGLSGGIDSSYLAWVAKSRGLRPLAIHVDGGWNSELAVKNIEDLVKALDIDLITRVVDWEEMQDLQVAYLRSGVANQDIPQDHAIIAGVLHTANKLGIKTVLSGGNDATEKILPSAWGYNNLDLKHLKSIHRQFGTRKLSDFPMISFYTYYFYYPYIKGIKSARLLNYIEYNKQEAMRYLQDNFGWRYYGGKHYESRFTKFYQAYYLPQKFGFDKRRAHLSNLIASGQLTREVALEELDSDIYPAEQLREDRVFVIKKLGLTEDEFEQIRAAPIRSNEDYPSNEVLFQLKNDLKKMLARS